MHEISFIPIKQIKMALRWWLNARNVVPKGWCHHRFALNSQTCLHTHKICIAPRMHIVHGYTNHHISQDWTAKNEHILTTATNNQSVINDESVERIFYQKKLDRIWCIPLIFGFCNMKFNGDGNLIELLFQFSNCKKWNFTLYNFTVNRRCLVAQSFRSECLCVVRRLVEVLLALICISIYVLIFNFRCEIHS